MGFRKQWLSLNEEIVGTALEVVHNECYNSFPFSLSYDHILSHAFSLYHESFTM